MPDSPKEALKVEERKLIKHEQIPAIKSLSLKEKKIKDLKPSLSSSNVRSHSSSHSFKGTTISKSYTYQCIIKELKVKPDQSHMPPPPTTPLDTPKGSCSLKNESNLNLSQHSSP